MNNIVKPIPCEILSVNRESLHEYTYRVKNRYQTGTRAVLTAVHSED